MGNLGHSAEQHLVLVEPDPKHISMMYEHLALNNIPNSSTTVFHNYYGSSPDPSLSAVTLAQVLHSVDHVDLLDMDCQGGEAQLVQTEADTIALQQKVYRIRIETHSRDLSSSLDGVLRRNGFIILDEAPYQSRVQTQVGPIMWRGGRLKAVNSRFVQ